MITVIVPTQGRLDLLEVALKSLCEQSYPHNRYEVIVVEDGGSHRTKSLVERFAERSNGFIVRYIAGPKAGVNAARNLGLSSAAGDPIVFTDDDIEAPSQWLSELVAGVSRHPSADCAGGPVRIRYEGRPPRLCHRHTLGKGEVDLHLEEGPMEKRNLIGANIAVRRSAIERSGRFDERVACGSGADSEWQTRIRGTGGTVVYLPAAWIWHRRTPDMLRLHRMLWQRFWRSLNSTLYLTLADRRPDLRDQARRVPRYLMHAYKQRCIGGLLKAAISLGSIVGILLDKAGVHPGTRGTPGPPHLGRGGRQAETRGR